MKKIFLLCAFAFLALASYAQFGIKAGLNIATVRGDAWDHEDEKMLMGIHGGVYYNIQAGESFSVVPELVYSTQGNMYKGSGYKEKYVLSYINIACIFRYNTASGFYVGAGPQLGLIASAKYKEDGEDDEDIKQYVKGSDIGICARVGLVTKPGVGFYGRYNFGFTDIGENSSWKGFNSVLQVGLTYDLKMDKKGK
jgi:hypothetical protein